MRDLRERHDDQMLRATATTVASSHKVYRVSWWGNRFRQSRRIIRPYALLPQTHILFSPTPRLSISILTNNSIDTTARIATTTTAESDHAPTPTRQPRAVVQSLPAKLARLEHATLRLEPARRLGRPKARTVRDGRLRREARRDVLHRAQRAELRDGRRVGVAQREAVRLVQVEGEAHCAGRGRVDVSLTKHMFSDA